MQSDKHLNNAHELQNGTLSLAAGSTGQNLNESKSSQGSPVNANSNAAGLHSPTVSPSSASGLAKAASASSSVVASAVSKPTWRCDVCNYETNVARNLRIHMTSEKHTHNIIMLQQNVKRMQQLTAMQQQLGGGGAGEQPGVVPFNAVSASDKSAANGAEAALADMAYNQALFIQMMTGGQLPGAGVPPMTVASVNDMTSPWANGDVGLNPETMEPPPEPMDANPVHAFQCLVCSVFQVRLDSDS